MMMGMGGMGMMVSTDIHTAYYVCKCILSISEPNDDGNDGWNGRRMHRHAPYLHDVYDGDLRLQHTRMVVTRLLLPSLTYSFPFRALASTAACHAATA